jgi:ABC-type transport system substrate-binding protein
MPRRRLALLAALAVLAPACGLVGGDDAPDDDPAAPPTLPAATAVLRVASTEWPYCLNPLTCDDPAARSLVWEHVLPRLMEVDADGEYVPSPVLAGDPDVAVDADSGRQTVTFVLDEEARWHDGRPITSSDVAGTWLARRDTPGALTGPHALIEGVDDADPLVARVTLSAAHADWPELFGGHDGWLLQPDAFGGALDLTDRFDDGLDFGAGPFRLASFGERALVLVAAEEHWDPDRQPAVDQVRIERLPEDADLTDDVPGGIDLVVAPQATSWPPRFQGRERPTTSVIGLFLDRRSPPLGSGPVRAAIDTAVDRRQLLDELGGDADDLVLCVGWLPQQPACGDDLPEAAAAPDRAEALLDADAWLRDPGGGRGRPDLPLLVPVSYDPDLPGADDVAEALRRLLEPLGFGVVVQATDVGTWRQAGREASTGIGVFALPLGTAERVAALHRCDAGLNPLGWCEPANQQLAQALSATPRLEDRRRVAQALADLTTEELSWLPLRQRGERLLVDPDRVDIPSAVPLGSGPLGGLHRFGRVED